MTKFDFRIGDIVRLRNDHFEKISYINPCQVWFSIKIDGIGWYTKEGEFLNGRVSNLDIVENISQTER